MEEMMKRFICVLLSGFVISVCCAGCGGDLKTNDDSSDKKAKAQTANSLATEKKLIEPGQLISREEAEAFVGEALKEGQSDENPAVGMKKCFYGSAKADSGKFFQISIQQTASMPEKMRKAGQSPKTIFANNKNLLAEGRIDLSGVGDEAFIGTIALHILKDDYYITIRLGNPDGKGSTKELEAAGKKALENLQQLMVRNS
jgi:hypothetical protein